MKRPCHPFIATQGPVGIGSGPIPTGAADCLDREVYVIVCFTIVYSVKSGVQISRSTLSTYSDELLPQPLLAAPNNTLIDWPR